MAMAVKKEVEVVGAAVCCSVRVEEVAEAEAAGWATECRSD